MHKRTPRPVETGCEHERNTKGIGVAIYLVALAGNAQAETPSRPGSVGSLQSLFTADDYPVEARRKEEQGRTHFRLDIDSEGRVADCLIVNSSGSRSLDETSCAIVTSRARYTPAKDDAGRAVSGMADGIIYWSFGDDLRAERISASLPEPSIINYVPGRAMCSGAAEAPVLTEMPVPLGAYFDSTSAVPTAVTLRFQINPAGRPLSIVSSEGAVRFVHARDVGPAFAAWRFAKGAHRRDCQITFAPVIQALTSAPMNLLHRITAATHALFPVDATIQRLAFERSQPVEATCYNEGEPKLLKESSPDFSAISQPPGTFSYAALAFDISPGGDTSSVHVLSSSNGELERQSIKAVRDLRFAPGARAGCRWTFWRGGDVTSAPPAPPASDPGKHCPKVGGDLPSWVFPLEYNQRGLEGWAIVQFNITPGGGTADVEVIASEPAARFGENIAQYLKRAVGPSSEGGYIGCRMRIHLRVSGK